MNLSNEGLPSSLCIEIRTEQDAEVDRGGTGVHRLPDGETLAHAPLDSNGVDVATGGMMMFLGLQFEGDRHVDTREDVRRGHNMAQRSAVTKARSSA